MYRPENFTLNRATSNNVFCLALMPNWFSANHLKRQDVFNRAKQPLNIQSPNCQLPSHSTLDNHVPKFATVELVHEANVIAPIDNARIPRANQPVKDLFLATPLSNYA